MLLHLTQSKSNQLWVKKIDLDKDKFYIQKNFCINFSADKIKVKMNQEEEELIKPQPFYINIKLLNKEDLISGKVEEGFGNATIFGKVAGKVISKTVSDEKVAKNMSSKLVENLSAKIGELGIDLTLEAKFCKGAFFVIKGNMNIM